MGTITSLAFFFCVLRKETTFLHNTSTRQRHTSNRRNQFSQIDNEEEEEERLVKLERED